MRHQYQINEYFFLKVGAWGFILLSSFMSIFLLDTLAQDSDNAYKSKSPQEASGGLADIKDPKDVFELKRRVEELEAQVHNLQISLGRLEAFFRSHQQAGAITSTFQTEEVSPIQKNSSQNFEFQGPAQTAKIEEHSVMQNPEQRGVPKTPYLEQTETFETSTVKEIPPTTYEEGRPSEVKRSFLSGGGAADTDIPLLSSSSSSSVPQLPSSSDITEPPKIAKIDAPTGARDPRLEFDQAYSFFVQKNYASAQTGFKNFIKSNPNHSLVPNAVFWLGETHYSQGNYVDAAEAFDLVLQGYGNSPKAPESLVKKGMSLAALGKRNEACIVLGKMSTQYPSSLPNIKGKVQDERSRLGCP